MVLRMMVRCIFFDFVLELSQIMKCKQVKYEIYRLYF